MKKVIRFFALTFLIFISLSFKCYLKEEIYIEGSEVNLNIDGYTLVDGNVDSNKAGSYVLYYQNDTENVKRNIRIVSKEDLYNGITIQSKTDEYEFRENVEIKGIIQDDGENIYYGAMNSNDFVLFNNKIIYFNDDEKIVNAVIHNDFLYICCMKGESAKSIVIHKYSKSGVLQKASKLAGNGQDKATGLFSVGNKLLLVFTSSSKTMLYEPTNPNQQMLLVGIVNETNLGFVTVEQYMKNMSAIVYGAVEKDGYFYILYKAQTYPVEGLTYKLILQRINSNLISLKTFNLQKIFLVDGLYLGNNNLYVVGVANDAKTISVFNIKYDLSSFIKEEYILDDKHVGCIGDTTKTSRSVIINTVDSSFLLDNGRFKKLDIKPDFLIGNQCIKASNNKISFYSINDVSIKTNNYEQVIVNNKEIIPIEVFNTYNNDMLYGENKRTLLYDTDSFSLYIDEVFTEPFQTNIMDGSTVDINTTLVTNALIKVDDETYLHNYTFTKPGEYNVLLIGTNQEKELKINVSEIALTGSQKEDAKIEFIELPIEAFYKEDTPTILFTGFNEEKVNTFSFLYIIIIPIICCLLGLFNKKGGKKK